MYGAPDWQTIVDACPTGVEGGWRAGTASRNGRDPAELLHMRVCVCVCVCDANT